MNHPRVPTTDLEALQLTVTSCILCPRLVEHRRAVGIKKRRMYMDWDYWAKPLPSFGDPGARVVLLGLAPAAHGANRTGRMFTGDRSGDWVYRTLYKYGFAAVPHSTQSDDGQILYDAYITSAIRCAPPKNKPRPDELINCRPYLLRELKLLAEVQVVVALGKIAFDTYLTACRESEVELPKPRPRFGHGRAYRLANGTTLIGSYHPSQQNTQTGRLTKEMFEEVFVYVRKELSLI